MSNQFSNLQIWPVKASKGNLLANGKVTVASLVDIRFQVKNGPNGPFASLPARKGPSKNDPGQEVWYPEVRILDEKLYQEFQTLVKENWEKLSTGQGDNTSSGEHSQTNDGIPF